MRCGRTGRVRTLRAIFVLGLCLTSCAHKQRWVKAEATKEEKKVDLYECERDARDTFEQRGEGLNDVALEFFNQCMEARGWKLEDLGWRVEVK